MTHKSVLSISLILLSFFTIISSCSKEETDTDLLKEEIEQIKSELATLKQAYNSGKIISSVTPIKDTTEGSWKISFTDGTNISLISGVNGTTPLVQVDENNHWNVSYDNGATFTAIEDKNGNAIPAAGNNGTCVRVAVNAQGYYVFETYNPDTGKVIETITTNYSSNPKNIINSIIQNSVTGAVTITMGDGTTYTFGQAITYPQSIVILSDTIKITHNGTSSIEFRINPSNANVNINEISLDQIKTATKAEVSYITVPQDYSIHSIEKSIDKDGNTKRGQYILTIKDNGTNPDYSDKTALVIATKDPQGNVLEISSDIFNVTTVYPSSLPRVYITTPGNAAITSKTEWLKNSNIRIIDEAGNENLNVSTSIRGRGNSTWTYPKKPYAIKLDSKAELLGMPKHKRWVLLANWMDRTLLRNDIAFEIGRKIMNWAPRGKFVELYLNGKHLGNYYLCEQIKVDENRVNIAELDEDTDFSDASEKTGGYILEFDTYGPNDEPNYFYTSVKNYPVAIKEPDEEVITSSAHPGFTYIEDYVNNIETLFESDKNGLAKYNDIANLIDIQSYIDWWLVYELAINYEPGHPKSCYMYKQRGGKLYAGPVWDFDYYTFIPGSSSFAISDALWYGYLFKYQDFRTAVKDRWNILKSTFEGIGDYIESQSEYIKASNNVNIGKWPITYIVNGDENMSYEQSVERLSSAYSQRIETLDNLINNL